MRKKDLIKDNINLKNRVKELEEILCPCEQHDVIEVGYKTDYVYNGIDCDAVNTTKYMCKKCKKPFYKTDRI